MKEVAVLMDRRTSSRSCSAGIVISAGHDLDETTSAISTQRPPEIVSSASSRKCLSRTAEIKSTNRGWSALSASTTLWINCESRQTEATVVKGPAQGGGAASAALIAC